MTTATVHIYWENTAATKVLVFSASPTSGVDGAPYVSVCYLGRLRYHIWGSGCSSFTATQSEMEQYVERFVQEEIFGCTPEEDDA